MVKVTQTFYSASYGCKLSKIGRWEGLGTRLLFPDCKKNLGAIQLNFQARGHIIKYKLIVFEHVYFILTSLHVGRR